MTTHVIDVRQADEHSWHVSVLAPGDDSPIACRVMRRLATRDDPGVPLPPPEYVASLPRSALHRDLCVAPDPKQVHTALQRLAQRPVPVKAAEAFGRYLFACLLGEEIWADILRRTGELPVELALAWSQDEAELYQFPWQLMYAGNGFLAAHQKREVAITHRVRRGDAANGSAEIVIRPRTLFVVGAPLSDPAIQAGAEYLGLLRRLHAGGAGLVSRVLVEATPQQVRDTVRSFEPSIVHFICHGDIGGDGRGRIYLMSEEQEGREAPLAADQLVQLLKPRPQGVQVVVLNACSTGATGNGEAGMTLSVPFAAELVSLGVPVTVGNSGRIVDRACRLFTRRFYEALLQNETLAHATAEGRRTALALGRDPSTAIDWAFPALFVEEQVAPALRLVDTVRAREMERRAAWYCTLQNPPAFCGRLECMEAFTAMLYDRSISPKRVLAYEATERDGIGLMPRYGKTRLLQELASHAVRDGIVPCLVSFVAGDERPKDPMGLGQVIARAILQTRSLFGLPTLAATDLEVMKLKQYLDGAAAVQLHHSVHSALALELGTPKANGRTVGAALRRDLAALAECLTKPAQDRGPVASLVLLIDEVHSFGDAARELLESMLTSDGFGEPDSPVPVVLAFSGSTIVGGSSTAAQAITTFFERGLSYVRRIPLGAFRAPVEDRLAYRHFLLHLQAPLKPLMWSEGEKGERFFRLLHEQVRGVPSRLEHSPPNSDVLATIAAGHTFEALEPANDEDALEEIRRPAE